MNALELIPSPGPLSGTVTLPGSKSDTHRALIASALAEGESVLEGASDGIDTHRLLAALAALGVKASRQGNELKIVGRGGAFLPFAGEVDFHLAGTSFRFACPLFAGCPGAHVVLTGNERMQERPVSDLVDALRTLGANIQYVKRDGCPPLEVRGVARLSGGRVALEGSVSSQFLSALLLSAPLMKHALEVEIIGDLASTSYVHMTRDTMARFGVLVEVHGNTYLVREGGRYQAGRYRVDGDASAASYLWGLAAITGGCVRLENLRADSTQGDHRFATILEEMGCSVRHGTGPEGDWTEVEGPADRSGLRGVEVDMSLLPDTAQTLAVVAAFAQGATRITGLSTLKHKETDRLLATHIELAKLQIASTIDENSIWIEGGSPRGASIATYGDHRMAMAFSLVGARAPGVVIEDPSVVEKSFPRFWQVLETLGLRGAKSGKKA